MDAQQLVACQQFVGAQQQLGEIHHAFTLALRVVSGVELGHAPCIVIIGIHLVGAHTGFLVTDDEIRFRAYMIAASHNFQGDAHEFWIQAEKELKNPKKDV